MMNIYLTKIRNRFIENSLGDVKGKVREELKNLKVPIHRGSSIAIGVGSRGIDQLPDVVREVVAFVRNNGGSPFIIPAMGSHGGATAEGQAAVLQSYGISEDQVGAPVKSSMEVVELERGICPNPVFMDRHAYHSDGTILINKIKPHTDFHGRYESGLVKMTVIGLGKEKGAEAIHHYGVDGLARHVPASAKQVLSTGKIIAGIALIENAYDRIMKVKALAAAEILDEEPGLLTIARANMPTLPVDKIDVLIIDFMGKNISGVGMDTNIIGRMKIYGQEEPQQPDIRSIVVTDLTGESHGNATGIGLADIITKKLYDRIDWEITYKNIITSSFLERGKIPLVAANDREAMFLALRNCGSGEPGKERIVRIKSTLQLHEVLVSGPVLEEIQNRKEIEIIESNKILLNEKNEFNSF